MIHLLKLNFRFLKAISLGLSFTILTLTGCSSTSTSTEPHNLTSAVTHAVAGTLQQSIDNSFNRMMTNSNTSRFDELGIKTTKADYRKALEYFYNNQFELAYPAIHEIASVADEPESQRLVGMMYFKGSDNFPQDYKKSAYWLAKSYQGGDKKSGLILGHMFYDGLGVEKDHENAFTIFRQSVKPNDVRYAGTYYLKGLMALYGDGIPVDKQMGLEYMKTSARLGHKKAIATLKQADVLW